MTLQSLCNTHTMPNNLYQLFWKGNVYNRVILFEQTLLKSIVFLHTIFFVSQKKIKKHIVRMSLCREERSLTNDNM